MEHDIPKLLVLAGFALVAAYALWRWWNSPIQKTKRTLRDTERKSISEVRDGEVVKIVGTIRYLEGPVIAPLSGRKCAYFEVRVLENRGRNAWREVIRDAGGVEFLVDDASGKAVVDADLVQTAVVEDANLRSGFMQDPPPHLEAFLKQHRFASSTLLGFNKTLRTHEGVFEEGETVAVLGIARMEDDPDGGTPAAGYRDRPRRIRIAPRPDGPILISDDPSVVAKR